MKKIFTLLCCMVFAAQYSFVSAQTTTMKIWKGGNVTKSFNTTDVDSVTFETIETSDKQDLGGGVYLINGHKFIDLGLPSGLLWAETNIGAEKPADDGNYYAWGETTTKSTYGESNYFDSNYTTYSTSGKTTLEKQHDAAYVNWGSSCRMPTYDDFTELLNSSNCTWTWTSQKTSGGSSINGYTVTSTKNRNSIFLPASGYRNEGSLSYHGSYGRYWSGTLDSYGSFIACCLYFFGSDHYQYENYRYAGHTVRPVAVP